MSLRHLGQPLDIHGGGDDLIFPHHESETAQSEGASGKTFVRYWVHVAAMKLDGDKMSKSKGNMVFVRDALARVSGDGLRLYLLSKHYRKPFEHDDRALLEHDRLASALRDLTVPTPRGALPDEAKAALDDDLDTPRALRFLRELTKRGDADRATLVARRLGLTLRTRRRA
jgi:cysteinyl-tRNA synthetase